MRLVTIPQTTAGCHFEVRCEPEDLAPEGNCMASGDAEYDAKCAADIRKSLDAGDRWAWCYVVVLAKQGPWTGRAGLGGCSYESEADFRGCEYYTDLCQRAVDNLNAQLEEQARMLEPFIAQAIP
jgi:hypothetical protein